VTYNTHYVMMCGTNGDDGGRKEEVDVTDIRACVDVTDMRACVDVTDMRHTL